MEINEAKEMVADILIILQDIDASDMPSHLKIEMLATIANHAGERAGRYIAEQLSVGAPNLIRRLM